MPRKKLPPPPVSRAEALQILSAQMRKPEIAPNVLIKLTNLCAKIAGWKSSAPLPEDEGTDLDKLVQAMERKRRTKTQ
jgi:hypothetical protein